MIRAKEFRGSLRSPHAPQITVRRPTGLLSADDEGEAKRGGGNSACRGWGTGALSQARFLLTPGRWQAPLGAREFVTNGTEVSVTCEPVMRHLRAQGFRH